MSNHEKILSFLVGVTHLAEADGGYICYDVSHSPRVRDGEHMCDFSWGVGHPLASAFTEYVTINKDGTVHARNPEYDTDGPVIYPSLDEYLAFMLTQVGGQ